MHPHPKPYIRIGALLALTGLFGLAACEQQPVLGYCEAGDTCRYDLAEPTTIRNYSGYFPLAQQQASADVARHSSSASSTASIAKTAAPQVVAISN